MFSYFENRQTTYFDVFCLNFSIETKIKTLFLISYFNLSKKQNGTLGTQIIFDFHIRQNFRFLLVIHRYIEKFTSQNTSEKKFSAKF